MENPTTEHMAVVKRILRFLAGSVKLGCFYPRNSGRNLLAYSDSDHAGDIDTRCSTSGALFYFGKSLVSWYSQKQKVVALSSCEAEYMAATSAVCQCIWLAQLLAELTGKECQPVVLRMDSQPALALAKNPVFHGRSKHIDTRFHFIRNCVEDGRVVTEFVSSADQLADMLTKSLGRLKFVDLIGRIGLRHGCKD